MYEVYVCACSIGGFSVSWKFGWFRILCWYGSEYVGTSK